MNRSFYAIFLLLLAMAGVRPCHAETFFVYPTPPDTMSTLQQRADYFVSRFWNRCDFGAGIKNPSLLDKAFGDWLSLMPHASADTVYNSVDALMARFDKKGPEALAMANIAENWMWSDTATFNSDEVYVRFVRAAVNNKKIPKADKARYQAQLKILESSSQGATVPDFAFTRPDGTKGHLSDITGSSVLIFFDDPGCDDCNLVRVRLSADFNTSQLIDKGQLAVLLLSPGVPTQEWREAASSYPSNWIVGAMEDAGTLFDLRNPPVFVYLDSDHKVLTKNLTIDHLLNAFRVANTRRTRR